MTAQQSWDRLKTAIRNNDPFAAVDSAATLNVDLLSGGRPAAMRTTTLDDWTTDHPDIGIATTAITLQTVDDTLFHLADYSVVYTDPGANLTVLMPKAL